MILLSEGQQYQGSAAAVAVSTATLVAVVTAHRQYLNPGGVPIGTSSP